MTREKINEIVEKNTTLHPINQAAFEIHEEIMAKIASALCPEENRSDLLRMVIALKVKTNAFMFLLQDQGDKAVLEIAVIERFLVLYENCQRLCGFLIDAYDKTPEHFKAVVSKDDLCEIMVDLRVELENARKSLVESRTYQFPAHRPATFQSLILWTMVTLLGEEKYCFFVAEANDAFTIVRSHPKFAHFFEKNH